MHVVVSGAAGNLARVLLPMLWADAEIERVTAIDRQPVPLRHAKFRILRSDVGSTASCATLRGADAVVHLAYITLRGQMSPATMAQTNIDATHAFLGAAAEAGVQRIVFLSSAAVYGNGTDIDETAPLAPLPGFLYARHKSECEQWLEAEVPQAVRLRPHVILGPHAQPLLKRLTDVRFYPHLPEPQPLLQCVHELDVCKAVLLTLHGEATGAFNLAAPTPFSLKSLIKARHPHATALPLWLARAALWCAWRFKGFGGEPGWHSGLTQTLTLDCRRAASVLGWRPGFVDWHAVLAATSGK